MRLAWLALLLVIHAPVVRAADTETPTAEQDTTHAAGRPFIGVNMDSSSDGGAAITGVTPGTAAERFGLEVGDVIVRIDGTPIPAPHVVAEVLDSRHPGDVVEIELLRSGEPHTIHLELGLRPSDLELNRDRADHVVEVLQLRPGLTVADIGCGSGWLAEAIAIQLEGDGTVYAVEVRESQIDELTRRALPGVVPLLSTPGDISLPEESLDIALLHDVASHIDHDARESFYASVRRALRPGGRLVVFGPHGQAEQMLQVLREHGFAPVEEKDLEGLDTEELDRRLEEGIFLRSRTDSRE